MDRKAIWERLGGEGTPSALELYDALSAVDAENRRLGRSQLMTDMFSDQDLLEAALEASEDPGTPEKIRTNLSRLFGIEEPD
jgi:hypothetical protein